jgi:hypothetical protein
MFRHAAVLLGALGLTLLIAGTLEAQQWPPYPADQLPGRGPGDYLAWYKLLACWLVVVLWVRTTDWVGRDSYEVGDNIEMPAAIWNPIMVFSFLVAFLLASRSPCLPSATRC